MSKSPKNWNDEELSNYMGSMNNEVMERAKPLLEVLAFNKNIRVSSYVRGASKHCIESKTLLTAYKAWKRNFQKYSMYVPGFEKPWKFYEFKELIGMMIFRYTLTKTNRGRVQNGNVKI